MTDKYTAKNSAGTYVVASGTIKEPLFSPKTLDSIAAGYAHSLVSLNEPEEIKEVETVANVVPSNVLTTINGNQIKEPVNFGAPINRLGGRNVAISAKMFELIIKNTSKQVNIEIVVDEIKKYMAENAKISEEIELLEKTRQLNIAEIRARAAQYGITEEALKNDLSKVA